jgi:hypothetical protein
MSSPLNRVLAFQGSTFMPSFKPEQAFKLLHSIHDI